ncbi:MAG TPA: ATP-binding protein [Bacteroidales bacterium]|nr:ATP-binding protein [Bacteroidales bacterium]
MQILTLVLMMLFPLVFSSRGKDPVAEKGVLDLREMKDKDRFLVKLNGEWEFYWKKMLHPHDFSTTRQKPDYYGKVPSYWIDYPDNVADENFGYATYRLTVLLPTGFRKSLAVDLPVFDSSYDIYVDDKYIGGNGVPGKSREESVPEYRRVFAKIQPVSDTMRLVINVSNYYHRRGGFWLPARLGTFAEAQNNVANSWAAEWSVISLLLGFSILFFFIFIVSPREKIMIFFSMLVFGLAIRPLFTTHFLILNFINVPWIWLVRFEYIGLCFVIIGFSWFGYYLYPRRFERISAIVITNLFICILFVIISMPVKIFSYSTFAFYASVFYLMIYLIGNSFAGMLKKNVIDTIYLLGFLLVLFGGVHDIIVSLGRASGGTGYLLTYLVVGIVFIQAMLLLYKLLIAFQEKEKLQLKMEFMNRNLEIMIDQRTQELRKRNDEIELQNNMIAQQNKQLSDTIQLKNKIFSVIAHDLRSPVVNILYMLNLLKEKEYKKNYDTFANSSIDYAQRVIGLLENMLVWGRGQEDKIKFSPENHDLADIILTNLSIFKETADKKEISVNFTQVGSPVAFCDKDLLDIIIRNLLSNAVKYTPRKGRISIFLKDKKASGEGMMLKICDNGTGMSEQKQKEIFTSEEIVSTPGTENEKGTGLGLKLCYELVRINNGSLTVESRLNEGTCFIIMLPGGSNPQ